MATVTPHRVRAGRGIELALLLLALVIGVAAYALVGLNTRGKVPADILGYGLGIAGLGLGLHVVLRLRAPYADPVILPTVVALNGIGLAMIYRLDIAEAARGHSESFATRQLAWTALGGILAAAVLLALRDHRTLRRYTYTAMLVGLGLVVLPLVPGLGAELNGARIWVHFAGNSLQPAEFAKIALAIFFAGYLVTNRDTLALAGNKVLGLQMPRARDLGPIILVWAFSLGVLVFERDLGTSLLFFGLFVACSTSPPSGPAGSSSARGCSWAARSSRPAPSPTSARDSPSGCMRSTPRCTTGRRVGRSSSFAGCSEWPAVACSAPGSVKVVQISCRTRSPTSSSPRSARSSA